MYAPFGAVDSSTATDLAKQVLTACQAQPDQSPLMLFATGDGVALIEAGNLRGFQTKLASLIDSATPGSSADVKGHQFLAMSVPSGGGGGGGGTSLLVVGGLGAAWAAWKWWRNRK